MTWYLERVQLYGGYNKKLTLKKKKRNPEKVLINISGQKKNAKKAYLTNIDNDIIEN